MVRIKIGQKLQLHAPVTPPQPEGDRFTAAIEMLSQTNGVAGITVDGILTKEEKTILEEKLFNDKITISDKGAITDLTGRDAIAVYNETKSRSNGAWVDVDFTNDTFSINHSALPLLPRTASNTQSPPARR